MARYVVTTGDSGFEEVSADHVDFGDGCIFFYKDDRMILAYASGQWKMLAEAGYE